MRTPLPLLLAALMVAVAVHAAEEVVSPERMDDVASVEDVRTDDGTVTAMLVNHTGDSLENVRLAVLHTFLWNDEFHPGPDDPSRTDGVTLSETVPPHASVPLRLTGRPLPARADGRFVTTVRVESLVRRATAAPAAP
jgi:hypothetical protein